ncbi:MAG: hypothetical protein CVU43_08405 [Chloroflexi bacterium HGW-Chloroflexi-5]|jgi:RND family efflux transporter MFP subunit|nr:MAG: hypothetical protein CVU43_08405 [Chloroflexi bacterium HGW-Chloroflexi-5]
MKKNNLKSRKVWFMLGGVLVLTIIGVLLATQIKSTSADDESPSIQTAKVRTGDLVVSASGSGSIVSSAQAGLGFRTSGIVSEVFVIPGQNVTKGDVLANLENTNQQIAFSQAEANFKSLFSPAGIAAYQIDANNAEIAYNNALGQFYTVGNPIGSENDIAILNSIYITAQDALLNAEEKYAGFSETPDNDLRKVQALASLAQARINVSNTKANLAYYQNDPDPLDENTIRATLDLAKAQLDEAKQALTILQSGDIKELEKSLVASDGTSLSKLKLEYLAYENARIALDNTRLIAPFDGVVINLEIVPGQSVTTSPILTLTSLHDLQVKFFMDETDLAGLSLDNRTLYTFNAYPETTLEGKVTLIEHALQMIDGSPAVVVWGTLPEQPSFDILVGMTVDVEIIAGETHNALVIPIQALRELTPGSYAVFIVKADGSLTLTPVTIGLRDFANAEVLSGLEAGDVISTGTVETN